MVLTSRARPAAAGSWSSMRAVPSAVALPGRAVLKSLMDLVFILLQHLQSRPSILDSQSFPKVITGDQYHKKASHVLNT